MTQYNTADPVLVTPHVSDNTEMSVKIGNDTAISNTDAVYATVPLQKDKQGKFTRPKELQDIA